MTQQKRGFKMIDKLEVGLFKSNLDNFYKYKVDCSFEVIFNSDLSSWSLLITYSDDVETTDSLFLCTSKEYKRQFKTIDSIYKLLRGIGFRKIKLNIVDGRDCLAGDAHKQMELS